MVERVLSVHARTGGPRFFSQVADGEVEALSAANARRCGVEPFPEVSLL